MIGLDTNVMVRYIMQDDFKQSAKATKLIESLSSDSPGFVTLVSVVELYWVLTSCYDFSATQVARAFSNLLRVQQIVVEHAEVVWRALRAFEGGQADFVDCLIERIASVNGCVQTMTFDIKAAKHAGMTLLR
jgi:predicted nucleic-acid-binding protein